MNAAAHCTLAALATPMATFVPPALCHNYVGDRNVAVVVNSFFFVVF